MSITHTPSEVASLAAQIAGWSPDPIERVDELDPGAARSLHDLLAGDPALYRRGPVGPLYHWVYFQSWPPLGSLGQDGHPRAGELLPPLHDRRRMVAGGRCTFHSPLYFSKPAAATSSLANCTMKSGRSGELLFVTVQTTIVQDQRLCITDEQDLVYRSGPPTPVPALEPRQTGPAAGTGELSRRRTTFDPVTLFRFSALTANSHRIHYDQDYARDIEGYAGLVVHGPLLVLSMAELLRGAARPELATVSYRLHKPVFSGESVDLALSGSRGDGEPPTTSTDRSFTAARATILDPTGGLRATLTAHFTAADGGA